MVSDQITDSDIRLYSALSVLGDGSLDILEQVAPFFFPILRKFDGEIFDPVEIANEFSRKYKRNCTADVVCQFINYFNNYGWIKVNPKLLQSSSKIYRVSISATQENQVIENTMEIELNKLAQEFQKYVKNELKEESMQPSFNLCKQQLLSWLIVSELYDEKNIERQINYNFQEKPENRIIKKHNNISNLNLAQKLCVQFIQNICKEDQKNFFIIKKLATISLLIDVIRCNFNPIKTIGTPELRVYLDVPVVMAYFGLFGKIQCENIKLIVNDLKFYNAKICVYKETVNLVKELLDIVRKGGTLESGPIAVALGRNDIDIGTLKHIATNIDSVLNVYDIAEVDANINNDKSEEIITEVQYNELETILFEISNTFSNSHDLSLIKFIIDQNLGNSSDNLFQSKAILITQNSRTCSKR